MLASFDCLHRLCCDSSCMGQLPACMLSFDINLVLESSRDFKMAMSSDEWKTFLEKMSEKEFFGSREWLACMHRLLIHRLYFRVNQWPSPAPPTTYPGHANGMTLCVIYV